MLKDARLVELFLKVQEVERTVRAELHQAGGAEEDRTKDVLRHATATRKSLEGWIAGRQACGRRAAS